MARETLGQLMGRPEATESGAGAVAYVPKNGEVAGKDELKEYGQQLTEENEEHPEDSSYFTKVEGQGVDDPKQHFDMTSTGFFGETQQIRTDFLNKVNKGHTNSNIPTISKVIVNEPSSEEIKKPRVLSEYLPIDGKERPLAELVYNVLIERNPYAPTSDEDQGPFVKYGEKDEYQALRHHFIYQDQMGTFNKNGETITIDDLAKIGGDLLSRAQSHSNEMAENLVKNLGSFNYMADLAFIIPDNTQTGLGTIESSLQPRIFKANTIFGDGQKDFINVESTVEWLGAGASSRNASSFGTLNSPVEPFGMFSPGMITPILAGIIATYAGGFALFNILDIAFAGETRKEGKGHPLGMTMGRSTVEAGKASLVSDIADIAFDTQEFLRLAGFPDVRDNFLKLFTKGLTQFYMNKNDLNIATFFIELAKILGGIAAQGALNSNLAFSTGYYAVITKQVLQDIANITQTFTDFSSGYFGPIGAITSTLKSIEAISNSYLIKFVTILYNLGRLQTKPIASAISNARGVRDDENSIIVASRFGASRIVDKKSVYSPLSLKSFASIYLPNQPGNTLTKFENGTKKIVPFYDASIAGGVHRISQDVVSEIEEKIDKEYVPFSIHDLRTNEVIGLPAFIENIDDSFAVNYSTTQGYGRTDPVYSYSNTTRNISLSFNLVAMNNEDHAYMYSVLNKITAMCYPQRDKGIIRKHSDGHLFIQPFSQVPTASPVVRIRIGDLIGTNASAAAMTQIFGGPDLLMQADFTDNEDLSGKVADAFKNRLSYREDFEKSYNKNLKALREGDYTGKIFIEKHAVIEYDGKHQFRLGDKVNAKIVKFDAGSYEIEFEGQAADALNNTSLGEHLNIPDIEFDVSQLFSSPKFTIKKENLAGYVYPNIPANIPLNVQDRLNTFLDKKTNPIVRSFDETKGRGLAGVITSLGLNYSKGNWGIDEGLRSPMIIGIQLQFAPIHDMTLGLTYQGDQFAPTHPSGHASANTLNENIHKSSGDKRYNAIEKNLEQYK